MFFVYYVIIHNKRRLPFHSSPLFDPLYLIPENYPKVFQYLSFSFLTYIIPTALFWKSIFAIFCTL